MNLDATKVIENVVQKYNEIGDESLLVKLGIYVSKELSGNTEHVSDKFTK